MRGFFWRLREGARKTFSEGIPLVVYILATVEGFVWAVCSNCNAELFPGGAVRVSEQYREELIVRIGIF